MRMTPVILRYTTEKNGDDLDRTVSLKAFADKDEAIAVFKERAGREASNQVAHSGYESVRYDLRLVHLSDSRYRAALQHDITLTIPENAKADLTEQAFPEFIPVPANATPSVVFKKTGMKKVKSSDQKTVKQKRKQSDDCKKLLKATEEKPFALVPKFPANYPHFTDSESDVSKSDTGSRSGSEAGTPAHTQDDVVAMVKELMNTYVSPNNKASRALRWSVEKVLRQTAGSKTASIQRGMSFHAKRHNIKEVDAVLASLNDMTTLDQLQEALQDLWITLANKPGLEVDGSTVHRIACALLLIEKGQELALEPAYGARGQHDAEGASAYETSAKTTTTAEAGGADADVGAGTGGAAMRMGSSSA